MLPPYLPCSFVSCVNFFCCIRLYHRKLCSASSPRTYTRAYFWRLKNQNMYIQTLLERTVRPTSRSLQPCKAKRKPSGKSNYQQHPGEGQSAPNGSKQHSHKLWYSVPAATPPGWDILTSLEKNIKGNWGQRFYSEQHNTLRSPPFPLSWLPFLPHRQAFHDHTALLHPPQLPFLSTHFPICNTICASCD